MSQAAIVKKIAEDAANEAVKNALAKLGTAPGETPKEDPVVATAKREFAENRASMEAAGITEAEYVESAKIGFFGDADNDADKISNSEDE